MVVCPENVWTSLAKNWQKMNSVCCSFLAPLLHPISASRDAKVVSHHHSIRSSWNCVERCSTAGHSRNKSTLFSHCCCACVISSMARSMLSLSQCCSEILSRHCQVCWANAAVIFRSTLLSRPNKVSLKCLFVHMYVRLYVYKVSLISMKFDGRGRWVMHDSMQYYLI